MNPDYLVGTVLDDRYEITEMIGSGGMATVYKATCRTLHRNVAIKVLKNSLKYDSEMIRKFDAESRAVAGLTHPNIVQVYDVGRSGDFSYIVMEYVDGVTLKDYINKRGAMYPREAVKFAIQIGKALNCAHKNHVIHRDIKPHNVLITRDGMLKVTDFGIAQVTTGDTIVAGASMGSVHYISPEQGRGGYIDERSDLYSLGVVLYEMLTGKLPFDGANPVAIAVMKLEQEPVDCRELNPDIPDNIANVVMKAISKEQHSRYQTAQDMVSELEMALSGIRISGVDDNYTGRGTSFEERHRERTKKKNTAPTTFKMFIAALAAVAVIAVGTFLFLNSGKKEYLVPDLTNMTLEEAERALDEANLELSEDVEFQVSDEVEEGLIISQKPGINQAVKKNRKVSVVVSSGLENGKIKIPEVLGLTEKEAKEKLKEEKIDCKLVEKQSDTDEEGIIIGQSPKAGTKVSEGYTVILYVSVKAEKEEQITVPKITGYDEVQARQILAEAGLKAGSIDQQHSSVSQGTVISQSPSAKTGVSKGSAVDFTISKGEKKEEKAEEEPTQAPSQEQAQPQTQTQTPKKKTLTITIPDSANDIVSIKVVANGKTIHDKEHQKSEQSVDIEVKGTKDASVQIYIDNVLVDDKTISFD